MVSVFVYEPIYVTTSTTKATTTLAPSVESSEHSNFLGNFIPLSDQLNSIFDPNGVIISANAQNNMIDVSQKVPQIPYSNRETVQQILVQDRIKAKGRNNQDQSMYTEEAKIQIYAMTGIISMMLVIMLLAFTYFMVQKRKERRNDVLKNLHNFTQNPLMTSSEILNSPEQRPWSNGTMVRSNIWFDTLNKSGFQHSKDPMLTSFHSIIEEEEGDDKNKSFDTAEFASNTEKTSLDEDTSVTTSNTEDLYENYPRSKRDSALIQRSKSVIQAPKPVLIQLRKNSSVSDIQLRQPSIRFQSSAGRKGSIKRSMTFR